MEQILNYLFSQYNDYSSLDISLEITAVIFGLLSVLYCKQNNILVFPTGIINTIIFVYLLYKWQLLGDMMINAYYFSMNIYGWYLWTRKIDNNNETQITRASKKEHILSIIIFILTVIFVCVVYIIFNKLNVWSAYIDSITTAFFFVGMWLMAKRKIENWIYWIIGDIISIPLYFYKGLTFTSLQYLIFTFIAILGYFKWTKLIKREKICRQKLI